MGLRQVKKERTRNAILESARVLFFNYGYGSTTIEAIAEKAEVAVGTVYNYFESKSAIILAITAEDTSDALDKEVSIPENCTGFEGVKLYVYTFMQSLSVYPRKLICELMREAWSSDNSLSSDLIRQDLTLLGGLSTVLKELRDSNRIKSDTDIEHSALVIYGAVNTVLMWYATDENLSSEQILESLDNMLAVIFAGLEKADN